MRKWILKAIVQKSISLLPYKNKINYLFQKHITKGVVLTDDLFEDRLIHAASHINYFLNHSGKKSGFTSLELGTGWYPIVPISMYLCGAESICSIDIENLSSVKKQKESILKFKEWADNNKIKEYLPNINHERLFALTELAAIEDENEFSKRWKLSGFNFMVQDACHLSYDDASIDLIHSNNTLEHIYPDILDAIFKEFNRILKSDGMMSHFIDMSDHFAHLDKSITIYNYLQYSERMWKLIDNTIQPQNRWRINDYRKLYNENSFTIAEESNRPGNEEEVKNINIKPPFNQYATKDIAISHTHIFAKK